MQRQADSHQDPTERQSPSPRRGSGRSLGEMVVALVLAFTGSAWILLLLTLMRLTISNPGMVPYAFIWFSPGVILLLSGLALFAKARRIAQWLLFTLGAAAFLLGGWTLCIVLVNSGSSDPITLAVGASITVLGAGMLWLARWLGQLDASER